MRDFLRPVIESRLVRPFVRFDRYISARFVEWAHRYSLVHDFFTVVRVLTNILGIPAYLYLLLTSTKLSVSQLLVLLGFWFLGGIAVELGLKNFFARVRPEAKVKVFSFLGIKFSKPTSYSFPSGHGFHTGFIVATAWLLGVKFKWAITGVALVVAASRVFLGFHYVMDVVAGFILGALYGIFVVKILSF